MTFATILRHLRDHAGLTQQSLADAAGTSRETVARLETSQRQPSLALAQRLADALGVPLSAFAVKRKVKP